MKCSQCGCTEFVKKNLCYSVGGVDSEGASWGSQGFITIGEEDIIKGTNYMPDYKRINSMPLEAYICKKCGHVELQCSEFIEAPIREEKARIELENKKNQLRNKLDNLDKRLIKLEKIIGDENKTVKDVNTAKDEKSKAINELKILVEEAKKLNIEVSDNLKNYIGSKDIFPCGNN